MATGLSFDALHSIYASGNLAPTAVISEIYSKLKPDDGTFIAIVPRGDALSRCRSAAISKSSVGLQQSLQLVMSNSMH